LVPFQQFFRNFVEILSKALEIDEAQEALGTTKCFGCGGKGGKPTAAFDELKM